MPPGEPISTGVAEQCTLRRLKRVANNDMNVGWANVEVRGNRSA